MTERREQLKVRSKKPKGQKDQAHRQSMRTCVGCRGEESKEGLERFVYIEPQGLIYDLRQKAPGRGAWVHPRRDCILKALRGGFSRAMKQGVDGGEAEELIEQVAAGIRRRQIERFGVALRAGEVFVGQRLVGEALKANGLALFFLAKDASESTQRKFASNAERKGLQMIRSWPGTRLGQMVSREFVSIVGIAPGDHARRLMSDEDRWLALSDDGG